jgi:LCP family protein required for cell wall assembly
MQSRYPFALKIVIIMAITALTISSCSLPGILKANDTIPSQKNSTEEVKAIPSMAPSLTPTLSSNVVLDPSAWNYGLTEPEGQIRIALLGSDYRPAAGFRTDTIMIVSINPEDKSATVVSFPRDLYVRMPGRDQERINTAFTYGGFELFNAMLQENFGFQVDYYVMTNFNGFVNIIDSLDGIEVKVSQSFSDKCDLPDASNGYCSVKAGTVHMDGDTALWYARSRYTSSDFDRSRRSQEIAQAVYKRLLSFDVIKKIPSMYSAYSDNVETNLDLATVSKLAPLAPTIAQNNNIRSYTIGTKEVTPHTTPYGGAVQLPIYENIFDILKDALYTP